MNTSRTTTKIKRVLCLGSVMAWLLLAPFVAANALAARPSIAVIYPETREPYRSVFLSIISGIEDKLGAPVKQLVLKGRENASDLAGWLEKNRVDTVITLGAGALKVARRLPEDIHIVAGAVLSVPQKPQQPSKSLAGITLTTDPDVIFERLHRMLPGIRRVTVVYNPDKAEWLIQRARKAAERRGIVLNARPAADLRTAAQHYRELLGALKNGDQAVWLLPDRSTLDEQALLPMILKEAWNNNLAVVSSNPAHVRRGALLSLFPDNMNMGKSLAAIALEQSSGVVPLRDVLMAINTRTAEHLGISISSRTRREYSLVYP